MAMRGSMLGLLLAAAVTLAAGSAVAQGPDHSAERAELFAYLVRNPQDVRATLRYARLSQQAGDIEAAIGALERVLFFDPNEPNTRLYLGMLYASLGSYDMARGYFESVLGHPATPQSIKDRAAYLMAQAENRMEPSQLHGYVRTGLRWQSNGNYEADGPYIAYDPVAEVYFPAVGNPESDWNVYAQGGLFYSYDFGNQRGDRFEASLTTYNTRQFEFDEFDFNQAEVTAGVRFGVPTAHPTALAFVKPYLIASGALLDEEALYWNGGAGVQGTLPVGTWTWSAYVQAVWQEYDENAQNFIPGTNDFTGATGAVYSAGIRIVSDPRAASRLQVHLGYERRDVDDPAEFFVEHGVSTYGPFSEDYLSYDRLIAEMRLPFDLYAKGHHILVTPLVGVRYTHYDEVDPYAPVSVGFDPVYARREDWQYRAGLAVDYALNDLAGVGVNVLFTATDSNIPAYDTENLAISFGPHFRF